MSDDKLKALLSEAKSKGASEEQLVGIAQAFFSSKKKDSTELPSTGEVETTPSPSTIQPPGFVGVGGSPLREYEVKPTMTQEERQEMWTDLGYEEKDFKWLEAAGRAAGRKESIISEQLGIDVDAPDRVEEYNSRLKKSQRAISQFEEAAESGFKLSGALGPVTELTPEQIESERQETINTVAGLLDVSPEGLDLYSLKQHVDKNKEMTEGIMYQRTLDQAVLKELTEDSSKLDFTTIDEFTRTATTDAVLDIANRAAIFALDIAGDDVQAERFQQQILERNLRSNLELGIDPSDQRGITETWKDGERGMAVVKGVKGIAQSFLPIIASIANPTAGVAFAGASGTLGVYEQYRDRGDLSYEEKLFLAGASGTAEAVITSIGMGNVRRFRAAAGIADNISDATVGARKKAYEKALGYLKPYTEQVSKAMSAPATRAGVTILKDAAGEGFEEFSVELSQQILAHAMAGEDFDGFALSDAAILGSAIGGPMAGVSARAEFKTYKGIYDLPMNSKLEEFETLKAQHADLSSALSDKSLGKAERKIIKDELIKVKKEMTEIQIESARSFDKMSDEDKQSIIQLNKDIKRSQNTIKTTDSEAVKLASRKRLEAALKEKSRIEEGLPAVEPVAEPELVTPRKRPAVTTQVDEEITETIIEGVKEVIPRGDITLDEVQTERVRKVATSLKNVAPGITFELHSSRDTYNQTYDNAAQSKGHYNPETNKVHILVDKDSPLALDGWLLLKHEAIHPVLEPLLQADENFANKLDSSIKSLMNKYAPNSAEQKRVLDHAARYKKDEQSLELLTEFLAVFSEPEAIVKFQKEPGFLDRVKQILNSILQRLGIKAELPTNEQEVLDMLNTVSDAFQSGRGIKLDTPSEVRENKIRESVERIQDGKNPYEGALRPEVGEDIESVLDSFRGTNSNFVIAENFDHSLELRRMGFVEKVQLKDGSIVLSAPTVYEKPEIDGIFSVHSKSFVKEEDIQDKEQKAVAKTLNALAGKMDLPIAFVNRPDLNFNAALTYPDSRNDLKETTMVVNLHYANARTGASPFSFAIVDAVRKQNPKVIGDFIKSLEGIQNVMNVSSDVAATYLSYKEAAKEWRDLDESEVQFYALSMSIQETIDRVINKAVHVSFQDGAINFLQNIQEQFAEVLNEEIMEQTDGKGFKKIGLANDFVDLLDAVFVSKTVKANYVLSKDQEVITKNVLDKLKEYLSISKKDFAKIRRVSQDAIDLESRKGISLLNVLQDVFDDKTLELRDLEKKGEITKEESEAMMVEYLEDLVKVFNQIISKDRYEKFLNLDKVEDSQIVKDIKEFVASYVKNVDFINNNYQEIYSEFTDFAAQGFPEDFSSERKDVLDVVKKYYDTFPKSQADYLVNTFAGKIDATAFEADIYGKELVLGAYNLDLRSIAEIVNMPYEQMKQSVVQGESGFNLLMSGIDPKTIYQLEVEDIIQETVLKKEAVMEVTTKKMLAAKTVGEVIDAFERKGFKDDVIRIINEGDLEKSIPFQYTNKEGKTTTEYIKINVLYRLNPNDGSPSLKVDFDNTVNKEDYVDNKINDAALSKTTMSEVFTYTKDVAEILGVSSILFDAAKMNRDDILENPQDYAANLVYKAKGRDTRWYRRSIYNVQGINGGLIAKPSRKIAFYDPKIDEDNYYITQSSIVLGEASSYLLESFNRIAVGDKSLLEEGIAKNFEADFETNLREDLKSKVSRTEAVPIDKENPMWEINLENAIRSVNENSSIFVDAEEMMNVDLMSTRLESNRIRIAPTAIRESLIGLEEEGREAADATDGMFENSEERLKNVPRKTFFSKINPFKKGAREVYIDKESKIKKAVLNGFGDYIKALITNKAGATAYADREFARLKKDIFDGLSSSEEVLLDKLIFLQRVIQIDTNWDNRLRDSKRRLAVIESELEMLKEQKPTKELSDLIESKERIKNMIQRDVDKYSVRPKHPTSGDVVMNRENAEAALAHYKKTVGDEVYDKLKTREKKYFDAYRMILDESYKAGIINRETRDRFITNNYSPRMFLNKMFGDADDRLWEQTNLRDDQIKAIKSGDDTEILTDAQYMLSLSIRSLRSKQANNLFLKKLADEIPGKDLDWVKEANYKKDEEENLIEDAFGNRSVQDADEGFKNVFYRDGGSLRAFQIVKDLYDPIIGRSPSLFSPATRAAISKYSGTKYVKLFATGINTRFAITGFLRGMIEVTVGRGVYDQFYALPVMGVVAMADFFKGLNNAVMDTDLVEEYYKYGGGMSFLTLQGKPDQLYKRKNSRATRLMGKYSPVKKAVNVLAYAGEKSELALRLGIYSRTLKNLEKSRPELTEDQRKTLAVEEARLIADFSQGGWLTKDLDALKPYLNAGVQGTRGTVSYARKNPGMFTAKVIQATLLGAAITYIRQLLLDDDEEDKISPYIKTRYFLIPIGKDKDGKTQLLRLPKAHQFMFFDHIGELTGEWIYSTVNDKEFDLKMLEKDDYYGYYFTEEGSLLFESIVSSLPAGDFVPNTLSLGNFAMEIASTVPTVGALDTYFNNIDRFRNSKVTYDYGDRGVNPYIEGYKDGRTRDIYKFIAEASSKVLPESKTVSAPRMQAAAEKFVTNESNMVVALSYSLLDAIITTSEEKGPIQPEKQAKKLKDLLGIEKGFIYTIPDKKYSFNLKDVMKAIDQTERSNRLKIKRDLQILIKDYEYGAAVPQEMLDYISELKDLDKRFAAGYAKGLMTGLDTDPIFIDVRYSSTPSAAAAKLKLRYRFNSWDELPEDMKREISVGLGKAGYKPTPEFYAALK